MAPKNTSKTYTVTAKNIVTISVDIQAQDWEEAVSKAQNLKFDNFLTALGDVQDYDSLEITGIFVN